MALSLNCKSSYIFTLEGVLPKKKIHLAKINKILNPPPNRDNKFLCRTYFPSNAKFPFRWRYVEGRESILYFRRYAFVVDAFPVQVVQIVCIIFLPSFLFFLVKIFRSEIILY